MGVSTVTVVGAGNMGGGIAQAFAAAGCRVHLYDVVSGAVDRARSGVRAALNRRVSAGKMKAADVEALVGRIQAAETLEVAAAASDLVVEAVVEDLDVKKDLFGRLGRACGPATVLATNTSSFRVADIAAATPHPERVVGLHFFFPASVNALVEVIRGPDTSDEAYEAGWAAAEAIGKMPIATADTPGFCVNRFFVPWLNEACRLLDEGVASAAAIDAAARETFGIGMGPFALMNATGPAIALHAQRTFHASFGAFFEPSGALVAQVERGEPWPIESEAGEAAPAAAPAEVRERLLAAAFLVAAQLVADGAATARDTDLAAVTGLRWAAGPFQMMNDLGLPESGRLVEALAARWAGAVEVPTRLRELAEVGETWSLPPARLDFLGDGIARITLDRPERRNSLAGDMIAALASALDEIEATGGKDGDGVPVVRALILTGRGGVFAAGADIPSMVDLDGLGASRYTEEGAAVLARLEALPAPVIVAINGAALGGGLELALAGDILIAAERARLGLPEVALGLHPGWGGTQRLPRRIGMGRAKELVLTGRALSATEAERIGLVNEVVPAADLPARALAIARRIAGHAPLAVAAAKRTMNRGAATDLDHALVLERESIALLFDTEDKREGLEAFMERRTPTFRGR